MIYKMIRSVFLLGLMFTFYAGTALAQTGTIKGTITDQKTSEPVIGANAFIKVLNKGAATNTDGNFTIENVPYGSYKLQISYVGYTAKTISVTVDQNTVTVNQTLSQSTSTLEDIVVTAYGVKQKVNQLPYSAQQVETEKVTDNGSSNFLSSLSGRVAGMKVQTASGIGASTDIILRGYNSLTGDNQALIVVDGVPYTNDNRSNSRFNYGNSGADLDADNIASITVLKGPSAAALYGSRASNGAILIRTKQGAPGGKKVDININSSVGISAVDPVTLPKYQSEYGAGYTDSFLKIANPFTQTPGDSILAARYPADASWGPAFDPNTNVYQWDAFYEDSPNYGKATPWTVAEHGPRYFFNDGVNLKNSININGSIADSSYYTLGYSQKNQTGVEPNSRVNDYKINFKSGYHINKKLMVSGSANFSQTSGLGRPGRGYNSYLTVIRQFGQTNVDYKAQKEAYFRHRQNESWNLNADRNGILYDNNPYWDRFENYETDQRKRLVGQANATYDVLDWLSLTGRVSVDNSDQIIEQRVNVGSAYQSDYYRGNTNTTEYNYDFLANYNKQLTDKISVNGVVGANIRRYYGKGIYAETNGGIRVPRLFALSNSVDPINYPSESDSRLGVNGYFANLNFDYNSFLNIALTGRRDKSSTLPSGNNVYYYPSASAAFTFSKFIKANWLSLGKVRASWSEVGKTAPVYSLQDTYNRGSNFGSVPLYSVPGRRNNPNLKPEKTKQWEVGLQLGFANDRIFLDASYYDQNSNDLIIPVSITASTGYTSKYINSGDIENRGLELELRLRPISTGNFNWTVDANWSKNINKVKSLAPGINYYEFSGLQGGGNIGAKAGGSYGVIRGSDFEYIGGKRVVGSDGNYLITSSTNNIIGNEIPDWLGGISNQFDYKNFSFSFLIDVRKGGDIYTVDQYYGQDTGTLPITAGLNGRGKPKRDPVSEGGGILHKGVDENGNPNTTYAAVNFYSGYGYQSNPNAEFVYDGSYVKLRQAEISYTLPQHFLAKSNLLDSVTFSLVGQNLWIIYKNLPYSDPEQHSYSDNRAIGYQNSVFPAIRSLTFNLKLNL